MPDNQKIQYFRIGMFFLLLAMTVTGGIVTIRSAIQPHRGEVKPYEPEFLDFKDEGHSFIHKSDTVMEYVYNAPESENDSRYVYHWVVLKTALEKTSRKYGAYKMIPARPMTERRQLYELKNKTGLLNIMYLGTTPELEKSLIPVRIPVDRNLGGYCVMLIRKEDQLRMNGIKTLEDLKKLKVGLGYGWIDTDILQYNGLKVVTGSSYEGLFKMLVNRRFDVFSRSAVEVLDEYESHKKILPDIKIEDNLLLYYPLPMYFWFSNDEAGKLLAARVREGMEMMLEDGSYTALFLKYQGYKAERLHLKKRRIIRIDNPLLVPETPFNDQRLWYDPLKN